jgi:DNA (cytosine-5)-methyltransferase 1
MAQKGSPIKRTVGAAEGPTRGFKAVGLFSGIGGLELGLRRAGHETLLMSENDRAASAVLNRHFPDVRNAGDVRNLTRLPAETELLFGGFPCQDLSQAGETTGINGNKSSIVGEVFRLLRGKRVPFVLLENVPFMLQLNRGEAIRHIVGEFEELGYRWAYRVIDSRAFGLPQRRERVFLLASTEVDPANVLLQDDAGPARGIETPSAAHGFYWTEGSRGLGWAVDAVPTLKGGSTIGIPSPPAVWLPDGRIVTPEIRDAERLQGFDDDWTVHAGEVVRPSYRWKLVGNAVTVQVAEWIGNALLSKRFHTPSTAIPLPTSGTWPKSAWGSKMGGRFTSTASTWPVCIPGTPLARFLKYDLKPLSRKATEGFMRRLRESCLSYPEAFWISLSRHLELMGGSPPPEPVRFAQLPLPVRVAS